MSPLKVPPEMIRSSNAAGPGSGAWLKFGPWVLVHWLYVMMSLRSVV